MQNATATFRNGRLELNEPVDWPEGTRVEIRLLDAVRCLRAEVRVPISQWPAGFFERLREQWGDEPFERSPQGEFEVREDW